MTEVLLLTMQFFFFLYAISDKHYIYQRCMESVVIPAMHSRTDV